jgi:RHS repeat-associated protein
VWEWKNDDPFGNNPPNENPSGLGQFPYNNRFPGQYFDQETGTSHNWFRTYNPATGRYEQSDPIGLAGGISTYGYVKAAPLRNMDFYGLDGNISDYLVKPVVQACVRTTTAIVTATVGLAVVLATHSGNAGDACDVMDKPNSCLNDCEKIERQIAYLKSEVIWRYFRMLEDAKDLYNRATIKPLNSRSGTWVGHIQAFRQEQLKLREAIALAKAKGCKVDPDAEVWASTAPPNSPVDR